MTTQISHNLIQTPFRKNLIINGNFDIWQRGTSFTNPSDAYTADRWMFLNATSTGAANVTRDIDVPTFEESGIKSSFSYKVDVTAADTDMSTAEYFAMRYIIEGYDYARIAGGNVTVSFWIKSNKTGTYSTSFTNGGFTRSYVSEFTIDSANTWEKKTITVPMTGDEGGGSPQQTDWNYTNDKGLRLFITFAAGTDYEATATGTWETSGSVASSNNVNGYDSTANEFFVAQVQLEKGDIATPFEFRHYKEEMALCQRYFQELSVSSTANEDFGTGLAQSTTAGYCVVLFNNEMRTTPSVTLSAASTLKVYDGASHTLTGISAVQIGTRSFQANIFTTGMTAFRPLIFQAESPNTASIKLDAEL